MKPVNETSGQRLRRHRVALNLSQRALAELTGLSQQHVNKLECSDFEPKSDLKARYAQALGIKVADIWPYPDEDPSAA